MVDTQVSIMYMSFGKLVLSGFREILHDDILDVKLYGIGAEAQLVIGKSNVITNLNGHHFFFGINDKNFSKFMTDYFRERNLAGARFYGLGDGKYYQFPLVSLDEQIREARNDFLKDYLNWSMYILD